MLQGELAAATATFARVYGGLACQSGLRIEIAVGVREPRLCATRAHQWNCVAALHALVDLEFGAAAHVWTEPERTYREQDGRIQAHREPKREALNSDAEAIAKDFFNSPNLMEPAAAQSDPGWRRKPRARGRIPNAAPSTGCPR